MLVNVTSNPAFFPQGSLAFLLKSFLLNKVFMSHLRVISAHGRRVGKEIQVWACEAPSNIPHKSFQSWITGIYFRLQS